MPATSGVGTISTPFGSHPTCRALAVNSKLTVGHSIAQVSLTLRFPSFSQTTNLLCMALHGFLDFGVRDCLKRVDCCAADENDGRGPHPSPGLVGATAPSFPGPRLSLACCLFLCLETERCSRSQRGPLTPKKPSGSRFFRSMHCPSAKNRAWPAILPWKGADLEEQKKQGAASMKMMVRMRMRMGMRMKIVMVLLSRIMPRYDTPIGLHACSLGPWALFVQLRLAVLHSCSKKRDDASQWKRRP